MEWTEVVPMLESFLKAYADRAYRHPAMVRHGGTVLAFAMDDRRRIVYSVLDSTDTTAATDADRWPALPRELPFAAELAEAGVAAADQTAMPVVRRGSTEPVPPGTPVAAADIDPFLSSTARLSADAPFQVLSDGTDVYVFRQSVGAASDPDLVVSVPGPGGTQVPLVDASLLVDRFVLVGTELQAKREVRYQRSRSRTRPQSGKDGLGSADLDGNPFVEPTTALKLVAGLAEGRFAVVIVPTQVPEISRWQIFVANEATALIDAYSIARSDDGRFDTGAMPEGDAQVPGAYAGAALRFAADGDHLDLGPGVVPGPRFSFEAWLRPQTADGGPLPDVMALVGSAASGGAAGPTVAIVDGTRIRTGFGDGSDLRTTTSGDVLVPDAWQHLAVTFDGEFVRVYVGGVLRHRGAELAGLAPPATAAVTTFGGTSGSFRGLVDELRLWHVARSAGDVRATLGVRLTGLEAGLAGYWRLDDVNGDTAWDAVPAHPAAASVEGPRWVTSDAPISEATGLRRSSFRIYPRTVTSGLSALLYHQQEPSPGGYDPSTAKPFKRAARVMLAFGTFDGRPGGEGQVAVLDFGVSSSGRLAEVPTELVLPDLAAPTVAGGSVEGESARIRELSGQITALRAHTAALVEAEREIELITQVIDGGVDPTLLDFSGAAPDLRSWLGNFFFYRQLAIPDFDAKFRPALEQRRAAMQAVGASAPSRTDAEAQLATASVELAAIETALAGGAAVPMPVVHVDPNGLSAAGAILGFARSPDAPLLYDSALGRVTMYLRGTGDVLEVCAYDTFTDRARTYLEATQGTVGLVARAANLTLNGAAAPEISVRVEAGDRPETCTLTISLAADAGSAQETWRRVPRDPAVLADVLNGAAATPVLLGAAAAADGQVDGLELAAGARIAMAAGAVLRIAGRSLVLSEAIAVGATRLPVEPVALTINDATPVYAARYDPSADASTDQVPANLAAGSSIVAADPTGASGAVKDGTGAQVQAGASSSWIADAPGGALSLDGATSLAQAPTDADLATLVAPGDVTMEAWVRPGLGTGIGRVLTASGPGGSYALAIRQGPLALRFDGAHDGVLVPTSAALQISGPITLEAWVRPEATDGLRDIVAHGYTTNPNAEVYLRLNADRFQAGAWDGADHGVSAPLAPGDPGRWIHVAATHDGSVWRLYKDGVLVAAQADATGAVGVNAGWGIGTAATGTERFFAGGLDEVRIWRGARSAAEIAAARLRRADGTEPGLAGLWRPGLPAGFLSTGTSPGAARQIGAPTPIPGGLPSCTIVATVGGHAVETTDAFAADDWTHAAAVHHQAYAVHATGDGAYLDAGTDETLDLIGDLTIEAGVVLDDLAAPQGIASRASADAAGLPWALSVDTGGRLVFAFVDTNGTQQAVRSTATVGAGAFHQLAVTRAHGSRVDTPTDASKVDVSALVHTWDDIAFYIDGRPAGGERWNGAGAASGAGTTALGRALMPDAAGPATLRGTLTEVRVWSAVRAPVAIGARLTGSESGLVSWWRFEENAGTTVADAKSANHARFHGALAWTTTPDPQGSGLVVLRDGSPVPTKPAPGVLAAAGAQLTLGGVAGKRTSERFAGELAEVRVWRTARASEQIVDDLFRRLTGEQGDLLAYWPFAAEPPGRITDHGLRGYHLVPVGATAVIGSTAPIGEDMPGVRDALLPVAAGAPTVVHGAPSVAEYGVLETSPQGQISGSFKRCYGIVQDGRWLLYTGFKVGDLTAEWVGQAQFAPQLIGYVEGAPPVPSENLTVADDYADASTVALTHADSVTHTYASTRNTGFDMSVEAALAIGSAEKVNLGIGVETEAVAEKLNVGIKTSFENTLGWLDDASVGQGSTLTQVSSLGLRGSKEAAESARFKDLGARYLPENSGLALVQSQTADVFALRLVHTGALVSYQMRPNPDIPKDWNIITFRIADTYTKQGTLDGKVGLHTDPAYPQAGGGGSDRSYYKPIEAYALKAQITQAEQRTLARFGQYDAGAAGRRQSGRQFGPDDLAAGVLADKLPRFEKRNLVNTYVWTAAGGQFAEEESTLDTISESTGGSYSFKGLAGLTANLELAIGGAAIEGELTALFGGHIELSATKAVEGSTSFGVQSTAAPEAAIGALDAAGDSVRTPGKVDAYRYMTFYLEPTSEAFDAFYDRVVDPAWLQEDSPEAAALVQARQSGKRPPCWRVLHRVTYVSRVLPKLEPQPDAAPTLDDALVALDLRSNYELIRVLDPFVRDRAGRYADFVSAAQDAIRAYLPELTPHLADIVAYLVLYYGVQDGPGLAPPAEDLSGLAPVPPAVHAGAPQTVALTAGATLTGQALDERVPGDALTASWSAVDGPEGVVFADAHALGTAVSFPAAGVYVLRLTVDDGVLTAHDDVTITVTAAPLPDGAQPAPAGAAPAVPEPAG